ncbi:MAG: ATP-binding protein, partial [Chloroflexota bacterium]
DHLLAKPTGTPRWVTAQGAWTADEAQSALQSLTAEIRERERVSQEQGVLLRICLLQTVFGLSDSVVDILLVCLLPALDTRYAMLYAYLQNDVNLKYPSVDLVLNLLCASFAEKVQLRRWLDDASPLRHYRLLQTQDDNPQIPYLQQALRVDERLVRYLLDIDTPDVALAPYLAMETPTRSIASLVLPDDLRDNLRRFSQRDPMTKRTTLYLQGDEGVGKQTIAEALCAEWGRRLLVVETPPLISETDFALTVRLILREALLTGSVLYWADFDSLFDTKHGALRDAFFAQFSAYHGTVILGGVGQWRTMMPSQTRHQLSLQIPRPTFTERVALWDVLLAPVSNHVDDSVNITQLANNYRFTAGQIAGAIQHADSHAQTLMAEPRLTAENLREACRAQSNRELSALAKPIEGRYGWDDIVLPDLQKAILREIHNQVQYRWRVYHEWGFDKKLSLGKGLTVLFAGPSGTGKTMAAEIIAGSLGFDLYKIDLSTMVSKYIGETEKHLAKVFAEAQASNAILFFDEADAIFGKRSEVSDAQDRFANMQVSFLLQRMEEYDGVVVLTSNLRKNMDEAFVRRMQFIVEFPFPNADYREQIWRRVFPAETPLAEDINWHLLAERFNLSGGNIRNIALAAAFFAVADDEPVTMRHLLQATQREFQKMGKIVSDVNAYLN